MSISKKLAIVAVGLAGSFSFALPASAQGGVVAVGVVQGTVGNLDYVFPGVLPQCQAFSFAGTGTVAGVQADATGPLANADEGAFSVSANGASLNVGGTCLEDEAFAVGSVSNVDAVSAGVCAGVCPGCIGLCASADSSGLAGTYLRVGPLVLVVLDQGTYTLNNVTYAAPLAAVVSEGVFVPQQTPPATVVSALFAAAFQIVGAATT